MGRGTVVPQPRKSELKEALSFTSIIKGQTNSVFSNLSMMNGVLQMKHVNRWLMIFGLISFIYLAGCTADNQSEEVEGSNQEVKSSTEENEETDEAANNEADAESDADIEVTLIGTGSPVLSMERFSNTTLVEVAGEKLLFDVGRGAALRLNQVDISPGMIDKLFITHLHHDHLIGFADVLITGAAVPDPRGIREGDMQVWGPKGTENFVNSTLQAFEDDIKTRNEVEGEDIGAEAYEIEEGVVYENNGIEVIAFDVDHGPMEPALGYRVNYNGRSVVISGDTTYSENLIEYSQGTDLLVQEVAVVKGPDEEYESEAHKNIEAYHTTPEQAGEIFLEVEPELAVFTHIATFLPEHEEDIVERTNEIYDGDVVLGEDLMKIEVGEEVRVVE